MPKIVICNAGFHFGDAICQFGILKEYKENSPGLELDFVSCYPLHAEAARHTDLFGNITVTSREGVDNLARNPYIHGYDGQIEFVCDWPRALKNGIMRTWAECTLGFTPSTDKPYFLLTDLERSTAAADLVELRSVGFRKVICLKLDSPSDPNRGMRPTDFERVFDMVPQDVALVYSGPDGMPWPYPARPNVIVLPGYAIGTFGAFVQQSDGLISTHGGHAMLAHALDVTKVVHIIFLQACSPEILWVPQWQNLMFPFNTDPDFGALQSAIDRLLA